MTVRRGFLYLGVFLVAIGAVTLLVEAGTLDRERVTAALGLWPLAVIAIGAGLVLRRTPAALPAGVLGAVAPGLLIGGMLVAVPDFGSRCADLDGDRGQSVTHNGTFAGPARVELAISCGELDVTTLSGTDWQLDARDGSGRETVVSETADGLSVDAEGRRHMGWNGRSVHWDLVLPTESTLDLAVAINAGRGTLNLADLQIDNLELDMNAGDVRLDLTDATVARLDVAVNAAAAAVTLPAAGDLIGDVSVNAGSLDLCVPEDLGLRVRGETTLGATDFNGLIQRGDAWETPGYDSARSHADLDLSASVGSVDINPQGGCK